MAANHALQLRLYVANAFGLMSKLDDFSHSLSQYVPDIAIITESKLTADKASTAEITIPGYYPPIRCDRTGQGGGVAVWIRSSLVYRQLDMIPTDGEDLVWFSLRLQCGASVAVCAVYRSGSCSPTDTRMLDVLERGINIARQHCTYTILAGDFNVHNEEWLGSTKTTPVGEATEDFCYLYGLDQHVRQPTRGLNTLDLIMSDVTGHVETDVLAPLGRSDHAALISNLAILPLEDDAVRRTVWRYGRADWPRLRHFYRTTDWSEIITPDVDSSCENLTQRILDGMKKFIPSKTLKLRGADPVWWTPECTEAVNAKQKAWKRHRQDAANQDLLTSFRTATAAAAAQVARAKASHAASLRRRISAGGLSNRDWWSTIKQAAGRTSSPEIPVIISQDGTECTSNEAKADCFAQHFSSKCSLTNDVDSANMPPIRQRSTAQLSMIRFRPDTVRRELRRIQPSKATGSDMIPGRVLRQCSDDLCKPIARVFSLSFQKNTQPKLWKLASVVPVYKKNSKSDVKNYRPISLLPILSKVMETIVNRSITRHLEEHQILSKNQYGFRQGLSTQDVLTLLCHRWSSVASEGGATRVVAVDIAGAFDRVSHAGVLHKCQQYGITGQLHAWLTDYLADRQIQVTVGGRSSQPHSITAGVPQGSILGPTLFLVYTNDAEDNLPDGVELAVYADDTTLFHCIATKQATRQASEALQNGIDALSTWGDSWSITFEPTKSQTMTVEFHKQPWNLPPVTFSDIAIPEENHLKLLGVTFDSSLSFRKHLRALAVRGNQRLGLLRKAAPLLDSAGRAKVYNGFIRPLFEYCPLVWMGAAQQHLNQLDRVQRRALHIIGPGTWLPSLTHRRIVAGCTYLYKLHCLAPDSPLRAMIPPPTHDRNPAAPATRHASQTQRRHEHQLSTGLPPQTRDSILRAFPASIVPIWNCLPAAWFQRPICHKHLQTFKSDVHHHLLRQHWLSHTDSL